MNKKELFYLKVSQLLTHPKNMRRFYLAADVKEMANSILAEKGVLQPLIVMKDLNSNKFVVIDGNMRLAGAQLLADQCPLLECKIVEKNEAEQMLSMIIANQIRYDVDPVSEGIHYKSLKKQGLSIRDISKQTGIYEARIHHRIILADLDEPIQKLIVEGKLHHSPDVARALLKLDPEVRVRLATRICENPNVKIATILNACERLLQDKTSTKKLKRPAVELSGALRGKGSTDAASLRAAAKIMCHKCNQVEGKLREESEPAWAMIVHAADDNCNNCELKEMQKVCSMCPAVNLLRNLVNIHDKQK